MTDDYTQTPPVTQYGRHLEGMTDAGAVYEKRRDKDGILKRGWWLDGVWLGESGRDALAAINGGG